jgi:lysophospholipase L1-like esterase
MGGRLGTVLLVAVSLAVAVVAAEVGLRLAGYVPIYEVYSKPELFWQYDEQLGWSLQPGARGRYVGPRPFPIEFDAAIEINSFGLRGPEPAPSQPGELRVVVLGDSVVAGFEVDYSETFVARLEDALRDRFTEPVTVVNAGVRGYGTDQSLLWYRDRGVALAADLVVLVFSRNDFEDNLTLHRARRPFGKGAFGLRPSGALETVGIPVPKYELCSSWMLNEHYEPTRIDGPLSRAGCALQTRLSDHSAFMTLFAMSLARLPGVVYFLKEAAEPELGGAARVASAMPWRLHVPRRAGVPNAPPGPDNLAARALTTALLQALARDVRMSGARFLLVISPYQWERLDTRALAADRIEPHSVVLRNPIPQALLQFRNDSHLNALGHRVFAEALTPIVERELRVALRGGGSAR